MGVLALLALLLSAAGGVLLPLGHRARVVRRYTMSLPTQADPIDDRDALELHRRLSNRAALSDPFGRALSEGLDVCSQAIRLYGVEGVITSFNGGKDAVAILHLMRAALAAYCQKAGLPQARLPVLFFEQQDEFPEVDAFVREAIARYDLKLYAYSNMSYAPGLAKCINDSGAKAFVLGTRDGDPNAKGQQAFAPSSDWMPPFMRVNPVIHWRYSDVWSLLRGFNLPFCSLYERGYTSLGKQADTAPNPALLRPSGSFAPAWLLTDESLERAGRTSSKKKSDGVATASSTALPKLSVPGVPRESSRTSYAESTTESIASEVDRGPEAVAAATASMALRRAESGPCVAASAAAAEGRRLVTRTAALLVVGDEILSGDTRDENSIQAARTLRLANISLQRIAIVPDDLDEISEELIRMCSRYDLVLTSGGVGPTCDDVTIRAVGAAFGKASEPSAAMRQTIIDKMGDGAISPEVMEKMSMLPVGALLRQLPAEADGSEPWPLLQICNVFVLPGVPHFFASKVAALVEHFVDGSSPLIKRTVSLAAPEVQYASIVNDLALRHPSVKIGSYPNAAAEAEAHAERSAMQAARKSGSSTPNTPDRAPPPIFVSESSTGKVANARGNLERTLVTIEASISKAADVDKAMEELLAAVPASEVLRTA